MRFFGASVYLHLATAKQLKEYIELLGKYNIQLIFINFSFFEANQKETLEKLTIVTNEAKKHTIDVYGDIDFNFLKAFNLLNKKPKELISFFSNKGINGIRCDKGLDLVTYAKLTHNNSQFKLIINGSHNLMELEKLILGYQINNNNVISCYNFYPQRYTGSSLDFYLINQYESHVNNILFAGFVSLQGKDYYGPKKNYESLPSLEIHRNWSLLEQVYHLISLNTDIIIIANQFIKEQDLMMLTKVDREKVTLEVVLIKDISSLEKTILLDEKVHFVRPDLSQDVIRSSMSLVTYNNLTIKAKKSDNQYLEIGDVVVLNQNAQEDCGELQIVIKRIKNDGLRNLVAKIKEPYRTYFLSELKATRSFKFIFS